MGQRRVAGLEVESGLVEPPEPGDIGPAELRTEHATTRVVG
jgi:hypothetical protein